MSYYDDIASGYNELHKQEQLNKLRIIKHNLNIKKDSSLLDVGCGTAFSLEYFNCSKTGIDPSFHLLKQSKSHVVCGMAEYLPLKDNSFDFVISITSIHNFNNIEKALLEMKRVGKNFGFSILKKSKEFELIKKLIEKNFLITNTLEEDKDIILIGKA